MKQGIANLLLVVGTVLGGVAAANSAKASRVQKLDADAYPGEFVARDVTAEGTSGGEDEVVVAAAGDELSAEVVTRLRGIGLDAVEVKDPPTDSESVSTADRDALADRLLAAPVTIGQETNTIPEGRKVTESLVARCEAAGKTLMGVAVGSESFTRGLDEVRALLADEADVRVAADFDLDEDVVLEEGAFLDEAALDGIAGSGIEAVELRIVKRFRFGVWEQRYLYILAVIAMGIGVALKRSAIVPEEAVAAGGGLPAGEVPGAIAALAKKTAALAARADDLSAEEIHAAVDPILAEDVYTIVESREAVSAKLGATAFVEVYGPFASAERLLNRAWSAAVDGYVDEARDAVKKAAQGFAGTATTLS